MAKTVNLAIDQGETWRWSFVWASPDPASTDAAPLPPIPFDLTGATARLQVREKYGTPVLVELTTENSGIALNGSSGRIDIVFTDAQTDTLGASADPLKPRRKALYDLEVQFSSGDVRRVLEGAIAFDQNITRDMP